MHQSDVCVLQPKPRPHKNPGMDDNGFWLHLKRLEGGRFRWPKISGDEKTMILTDEELSHLLGNPGLEQKLRRKQTTQSITL